MSVSEGDLIIKPASMGKTEITSNEGGEPRSGVQLLIFRKLRDAAIAGEPAPTYQGLARLTGSIPSVVASFVQQMQNSGLFKIENRNRTVLRTPRHERRYVFSKTLATEWESNLDRHRGGMKVRACMNCDNDFESTWIGNRLCLRCKAQN